MKDKPKILGVLGLGFALITGIMVWSFTQEEEGLVEDKRITSLKLEGEVGPKPTPNSGLSNRDTTATIKPDDGIIILDETPKALKAPTVSEIIKDETTKESTKEGIQDKSSGDLWEYLNNANVSKEERISAFDLFADKFNKELQTGNVPNYVSKNMLIYTSESSTGFTRSLFAFKNGTVELITVVFPNLVESKDRVLTFALLISENTVKVNAWNDLDLILKEKAVVVENDFNYILVAGAFPDSNAFKEGEKILFAGFKVSSNGLSLLDFDNVESLPSGVLDNKVFLMQSDDPSTTPFVYTEPEGEELLPNKIYLIDTDKNLIRRMFNFSIKSGKISIDFVREVT